MKENTSKTKKTRQERPLHCPRDLSLLIKIGEKRSSLPEKGNIFVFPMYKCPKCEGEYTSLENYRDLLQIRVGDKKYTNILRAKDVQRYERYLQVPYPVKPGSKCYIYGDSKVKECKKCGDSLEKRKISFKTKKRKDASYPVKYCVECDIYYINYTSLREHSSDWILLNDEELSVIQEEFRIKHEEKEKLKAEEEQRRKKREAEKKRRRKKREAEKKTKKKLLDQKRKEKKREKILEAERRNQWVLEVNNPAGNFHEKNHITHSDIADSDKVEDDIIYQHDSTIRVKDFVIRRTTFKCMHQNHQLQNIDAIIGIIDNDGNIIQSRVPAGYCPNCNIFFIMESTYQNLKLKGTPICRISDEKAYLKSNMSANGMLLAQESILMQYGYSVSQEEGLTSARRRKILALLIDNKILTRSDIISYLDFFVNQRKYQHKFEKAIEKWESDREFISEYRAGDYTQYGVGGIYRKF